MGIIALGAPTAVGNALIPPEGPAAIPLTLDFTSEGEPSYTINVGDFMQKGPGYPGLSILQTLYVDLAGSQSALVVEVTATGQRLVIPPQTQGYYPIISPSRDYINFACSDDSAIVPVYLLNVPVPPNSWSVANTGGGIADAPNDGNEYVRKSGGWVELSQASNGGLADAPTDGKSYLRKAGNWAQAPIQTDAPSNGNFYGRTNGAWAQGSSSGSSSGGSGGGSGSGSGGGSGGSSASAAPAPDTWNPAAIGAGPAFTLDATKLIATGDAPAGWSGVQGVNTYLPSQGKIYFELEQSAGGDGFFGMVAPSASASDYPGDASGFGRGYDGNTHCAWGGNITNGSGWGAGDVIGFAVDLTAGSVAFFKNNVADGGITGMTIPPAGAVIMAAIHNAGGNNVTLRTTAGQCQYAPPAGFNNAAAALKYTYWRLYFANEPSGGWGIGELSMADAAGNVLTNGGTPICIQAYNGSPGTFGAEKAFDGNLASFWCGTSAPNALGYEFTAPVAVATMTVTNRDLSQGYGCQFPTDWTSQYSDDGVNWTNSQTGTFPAAASEQAFTINV